MAKFKIADGQRVMLVNVYEVEAETKEEALSKYNNELAGSLESIDSYITDDTVEGTSVK